MTTQTTAPRTASAATRPVAGSYEYSLYIATTAEKLWGALTINELRRHWWRGHTVETEWRPGGPITGRFPDGSMEFLGHVVTSDRPARLVFEVDEVSWTSEFDGQGPNRLSFQIEPYDGLVKLSLRNEAPPKMLALVSQGWPAVLSSLKSLLETGNPLPLDVVFGPERNPGG